MLCFQQSFVFAVYQLSKFARQNFCSKLQKQSNFRQLTLYCQRLLILFWSIQPASAAKALCLQKLMQSATAAISLQGGEDRPSLFLNFIRSRVLTHTSRLSPTLLVAANALSPHLPPCFVCVSVNSSSNTHMRTHCFRKSTIFIYWGQASTEAKIMTDNHTVFVIYGEVPRKELIQLPFPNPVCT